jgi:hypothetical protein
MADDNPADEQLPEADDDGADQHQPDATPDEDGAYFADYDNEGAGDPKGAANKGKGESSKDSFNSAVQHFNIFLNLQIEEATDGKAIAKLLFRNESPVNPSYATANKVKINVKVMDRFALYLAQTARCRNNKKQRIQFHTADRYLSAIKNNISGRLLYSTEQSPLTDAKMKSVRTGMFNIFFDRAVKSHQSMSKSIIFSLIF